MKKLNALLLLGVLSNQVFALHSDSVEKPFYEVQKTEDGYSNNMQILNSGIAAFWKRIELIRSAKESVEVEYFIYGLDETAKAFTTELVAAAKRGVKVRVLVDKSASIFELDEFYAEALKKVGVEVRYYNPAPIYQVSTINFRNHRKLLTVDDKYAITGGRNIENDYFDYSEEFNFLDRDVFIEGDIAKTMRKSFDAFFEHEISERPSAPVKPNDTITVHSGGIGKMGSSTKEIPNKDSLNEFAAKQQAALDYITETPEDIALKNKYEVLGIANLEKTGVYSCPELTYSTDKPGGEFVTRLVENYDASYRVLRKTLRDKASTVNKKIVVSSPYMINSPRSLDMYMKLINRDVEIDLYTNSMASTDALYVAANLYRSVFVWKEQGINTYVHPGKFQDEGDGMLVDVTKAKWGTHSKTQLYEYEDNSQNEFMVGTYNYDNRSNHYNTEMGVFCKGGAELYQDVAASIETRMKEAYLITDNFGAVDKDGNKVSPLGANKDDLLLMVAMAPFAWLAQLLL